VKGLDAFPKITRAIFAVGGVSSVMTSFPVPTSFLGAFLAAASFPLIGQESDPALPPGTMLLTESALPEYESGIDHAKLIRQNGKEIIKLSRNREVSH